MECPVDPSSKPSILHTQVAYVKGKSPLLQNVWLKLEYKADVNRITSTAHSGTINYDTFSLMSVCSEDVPKKFA
jgi:hypothetical protein